MDPDNPVIRLCVQGVEAESEKRYDDARALFELAWKSSSDNVEACIAAHYLARHQTNLDQALWWNQIALARADSVRDERVRSFYSSLHLNLGMAHEKVGQTAVAHHHYERAAAHLDHITDNEHRVLVEYGVTRGLKRTEPPPIRS